MPKVQIPFKVVGWEQTPYGEAQEGRELARATVKKQFTGELEGESTAELLMCGSPGGNAGYVASEIVTGSLAGRAGSFALQHGATMDASGNASFYGVVVPGSGRGELHGLRGTARLEHELLTFDYELD